MQRKIKEDLKSLIGAKRGRKNKPRQENPLKEKEKISKTEKFQKYSKDIGTEENYERKGKNNINNINFCLTVHATEQDFKNPIKYLENLWRENKESTGIIKIIPPERWKVINKNIFSDKILPNLENNQKTFETRIQTLDELFKGKKFEYARDLNFEEYYNHSEKFFLEMYPDFKPSLEKIEKDYWKFCKNSEKNIKVRYAADLSYKQFLSKNEITQIHKILENNDIWNFLTLFLKDSSLFRFLKDNEASHISGLTIPWLYFGMLYSTFCWHVEDLYLYSVNYMHYGQPKIWYGIPHNEKEKMDAYMKREILKRNIDDKNIVHKLVLLIDPESLLNNGIHVYKAIQHPGELILTLPKAYHCGFSTGFNISEAVNLATCRWVDIGLTAQANYNKTLSKMPVFPLDWLVYQNYRFINKEENLEGSVETEKFKKFVKNEKCKRKKTENILAKKNVPHYHMKILSRDAYHKYECDLCSSYGFFSFMICINCNQKICLSHCYCRCANPMIQLMYRDL